MLWLVVFFVVPMIFLVVASRCRPGGVDDGLHADLARSAPTPTRCSQYWPQFAALVRLRRHRDGRCACSSATRSRTRSRFKAGRWKNLLLVLVIAPFFTSFLIRTLAWQTILADDGPVVGAAATTLHVLTCCSSLRLTRTTGCSPRRSR